MRYYIPPIGTSFRFVKDEHELEDVSMKSILSNEKISSLTILISVAHDAILHK